MKGSEGSEASTSEPYWSPPALRALRALLGAAAQIPTVRTHLKREIEGALPIVCGAARLHRSKCSRQLQVWASLEGLPRPCVLPLQWLASSAARVCLTRHTHLCNSRGHVAGRPSHTDRRFRQNRDRHARAEREKEGGGEAAPAEPTIRTTHARVQIRVGHLQASAFKN